MAITTTSSQDAQTSIVSVAVECVPFELVEAECQTPSCEQVSTFSATIDPELLQTQCPDQTTLPTSTEVQLSLPVTVGVGPVGAGELASSNHLITYTVDVVDKVVLNATHESNSVNAVQEDLDLGVAAWRVELANELATPCNVDEHVSASESLAANGRVCIKVNSTKQDADDYVAFIESATLTNNDKGVSTVLVAGRSHGSSSTDEAYAGAFFNDAHLDGDLTDDYVDYLTFFIDPELRPAEGETASLSLVMNVAYHHVATGRRVLAERVSMPMTMDAGEDETVLDLGTTAPEHCPEGDAAVDATLALTGLPISDATTAIIATVVAEAAGTVDASQVTVTSVARDDAGSAVGFEVSGCGEEAANDIVLALENDVASGSFYFRLLMAGVSPEALDGISIVYIDTRSTPGQLVEVSIQAAVVLDGVDADAFNADAGAQSQFKKAIVAAVEDVVSTDQITELHAKATERRRLATSGSTSAIVEYTLTITKIVTDELGSVEAFEKDYLDSVTTSLATATADAYFIEILQAEPLFKDASVDVGATFNFLKGATIEADPVEEDPETSADSDAEPKTAGLPIVAAIVAGASLLGAATGAYIVSKYREAYQTERIAPEVYVKDIDLETPPATLPANPALFVRR
mmetsp:Transcript_19044/g.49612  ORF Transcript_19044/g.49612 Transcript_19044/m.49612 type:complete len:635 (+) Transcript_19044:371-2275(+)